MRRRQRLRGRVLRGASLLLLPTARPQCRHRQRRESGDRLPGREHFYEPFTADGSTATEPISTQRGRLPAGGARVITVDVGAWTDQQRDDRSGRRHGETEQRLRQDTAAERRQRHKSFYGRRQTQTPTGDGERLAGTRRRGSSDDIDACGIRSSRRRVRHTQPTTRQAAAVSHEVSGRRASVRWSSQVIPAVDCDRCLDECRRRRPAVDRDVLRLLPCRQSVVRGGGSGCRCNGGIGVRRGSKGDSRARRPVDGHRNDVSWNDCSRLLHGARAVQPPAAAAAAAPNQTYGNAAVWEHCGDAYCE